MPIETGVIAVEGDVKRIFDPSPSRRALHIYNESGETVYLGGSDVTTADGFPLRGGGSFWLQQGHPTDATVRAAWYAVADAAASIRILEVEA